MNFQERRVARYFAELVLRDPDLSITVRGEDEEDDLSRSRSRRDVVDTMGWCDYCMVGVFSESRNKPIAWFQFVLGNVTDHEDRMDFICDYSANEYADDLHHKLTYITEV